MRPTPLSRRGPGVRSGPDGSAEPALPEPLRTAVSTLFAEPRRGELAVAPIRPPQRLAPWSRAWELEAVVDDDALATGRLVLLHDPDGQDAWEGTLRLVGFVRAELDGGLADDPLLTEVGWSWLTEALDLAGAGYVALGGTVTRTTSARFGDIAGPEHSADVELRASWTPVGDDLRTHGVAFADLLASAAGLPPAGVSAFGRPTA